MRKNDLTGRRFGKLKVFSEVGRIRRGNRSRRVWKCQCDCGNWLDVIGEYLTRDIERSCGCYKKPKAPYSKPRTRLAAPEAAMNSIESQYICRSRRLGQEYQITRSEFETLVRSDCAYCGEPPSSTWSRRSHVFKYSGIDRVDSSQGYVSGNVVPCCTYCNRGKSDQTEEQFIDRARRVARRKGGAT